MIALWLFLLLVPIPVANAFWLAQESDDGNVPACHVEANPTESSFLDLKGHVLGVTCPQIEASLDQLFQDVGESGTVPNLQLLRGQDYYWHKMFLLYNLYNMKKRYAGEDLGGEDKNHLVLIERAIERISSDQLPLALMTEKETNAGTLRFGVGNTPVRALTLNQDFVARLFNNPGEMQGILMQEFQHLDDIETIPKDDPKLRVTSRQESRGHMTMMEYWKRLPEPSRTVDGTHIQRAIEAGSDAPDGPRWRAYLDDNQGMDFDYLDRFELEAHSLVQSGNANAFYGDFLVESAHSTLKIAKDLQSGYIDSATRAAQFGSELLRLLQEEEPKKIEILKAQFRRVQTYLRAAIAADASFRENGAELLSSARKQRENWVNLNREIIAINDQLAQYLDFLQVQGIDPMKPSTKLTALGEKNLKQFEKWYENKKDMTAISSLELCEEQPPVVVQSQPSQRRQAVGGEIQNLTGSSPLWTQNNSLNGNHLLGPNNLTRPNPNAIPPKPAKTFRPSPVDNNTDRAILTSEKAIKGIEQFGTEWIRQGSSSSSYTLDEKSPGLTRVADDLRRQGLTVEHTFFYANPLIRVSSASAKYSIYLEEDNGGGAKKKMEPFIVEYIKKTQSVGSEMFYDHNRRGWRELKHSHSWLYYEHGSKPVYNGDKENTATYEDVFASSGVVGAIEDHANATIVSRTDSNGRRYWTWADGQRIMPLIADLAEKGIYFDSGSFYGNPEIELIHNDRVGIGHTKISINFEAVESGRVPIFGKTKALRVREITKRVSKFDGEEWDSQSSTLYQR